MIKVIALDFDGVIMDSVYEIFVICKKLLEEKGLQVNVYDIDRFRSGRNFLRSGSSLYGIIEFFKQGRDFDRVTQEEIDNFVNEHEEESKKFSDEFFAVRRRLQDENLENWFSLLNLFPGIKKAIERLSERFHIVIMSTRDFYSISAVFKKNGIKINDDNIISKETYRERTYPAS